MTPLETPESGSNNNSVAVTEDSLPSEVLMNPEEEKMNSGDEFPDEVEMSLFDHLEELRQRIFYSLIAVVISAVGCFIFANSIVEVLQKPAQGVKFLQLAPGEYFFVSIQVAGYSGLVLASPFILYQIVRFVLPGISVQERRFLGPIFFGSTILFGVGLVFAYVAIVPAALKFFIGYGGDVVEQFWSIEKYFSFVNRYWFIGLMRFVFLNKLS